MEWTIRLVRHGDKGYITLSQTVYPSRGKAAKALAGYTRDIIRQNETCTYLVVSK